ncbi:glycosyltransferase family 2 protein [Pelotalea chapellei]|uniref:Glycosyltransferase family 2 protein n=1 Tax=Pelotalea chapellei TaxID=44671 RepID=A0ABS5U720_9BACT|nr:glycosyltransferase family 2 protein [Pelotalea chapellei]
METCILIPAYNAAHTIAAVVKECLTLGMPVVVVNDGSTEGTGKVVADFPVTVLSHAANMGKGCALKTGFSWAVQQGFGSVVTVDADGQHDVSAVPRLADSARQADVDILIASRFSQFEQMSGLRKTWNRFGVWCMRTRTGFEINDSQSGFRYYSSRLLRTVTLSTSGYDLEMEILMQAWRHGFRVACLPIAARVADGRSTSHFRPVRDTWNICKVFLRNM